MDGAPGAPVTTGVKPVEIYIPPRGANPDSRIKHGNCYHSAAEAYMRFDNLRPFIDDDAVWSKVKDIWKKMRRNGYKSPLECVVEYMDGTSLSFAEPSGASISHDWTA